MYHLIPPHVTSFTITKVPLIVVLHNNGHYLLKLFKLEMKLNLCCKALLSSVVILQYSYSKLLEQSIILPRCLGLPTQRIGDLKQILVLLNSLSKFS